MRWMILPAALRSAVPLAPQLQFILFLPLCRLFFLFFIHLHLDLFLHLLPLRRSPLLNLFLRQFLLPLRRPPLLNLFLRQFLLALDLPLTGRRCQ
jgi:hypothetical protein